MSNGPTQEQLSRLRWLSICALGAVFTIDFGFDGFRKPIPDAVYYVLSAIAIGINPRQLRALAYVFLKNVAGGGNNDADK